MWCSLPLPDGCTRSGPSHGGSGRPHGAHGIQRAWEKSHNAERLICGIFSVGTVGKVVSTDVLLHDSRIRGTPATSSWLRRGILSSTREDGKHCIQDSDPHAQLASI